MEQVQTVCYVCDRPGFEEKRVEKDGRTHVFFVHKRQSGAGRPSKCDAGYEETEAQFMQGLEEGQPILNTKPESMRVAKGYTRIAPEATTEVFVKMYMHTCQRCNNVWVTKKKIPLVCSKCTSRTWNMQK